ncbi:YdcF family protein [Psychromonas ossibalaenae]|uniref:YdcF family protein n=1 Tax=Psychromonas ossibalaenae TaxID=444922 RepID=UPI00035DD92C|nr:YdcF family protein [Psychromonas ossibalaenae]
MNKKLIPLLLTISLIGCKTTEEAVTSGNKLNIDNHIEASNLIQLASYYELTPNHLLITNSGIDLVNSLELKSSEYGSAGALKNQVAEQLYKQAAELEPNNLNHKFSLAFAQVVNNKAEDAIETYDTILAIDSDNTDALSLKALYAHAVKKNKISSDNITKLQAVNVDSADLVTTLINTVDQISSQKVIDDYEQINLKSYKQPVIWIFGHALDADGTANSILNARLDMVIALAKKHPHSKIMVTGGVPKQGNTEARVMRETLAAAGIDASRVIIEDRSTDTVQNVTFGLPLLSEHKPDAVVLISSPFHLPRAASVFKMHALVNDFDVEVLTLASLDNDSNPYATYAPNKTMSDKDYLDIFRDTSRAVGFFAYPPIKQ